MEIKTEQMIALANEGIAVAQAAKKLSQNAKLLEQGSLSYAADRMTGEIMENVAGLPVTLVAKEAK